jgi:hypothetical protein
MVVPRRKERMCMDGVHGRVWMYMDVNGASEATIDIYHLHFFLKKSRIVPNKQWLEQGNNSSRTQSALNPTWPLKIETIEDHNHTLPNWYRILAWFPSQPSLSLMVSFRFLLLRLICLVNSILHNNARTCNIKDSNMSSKNQDITKLGQNMEQWFRLLCSFSISGFLFGKVYWNSTRKFKAHKQN